MAGQRQGLLHEHAGVDIDTDDLEGRRVAALGGGDQPGEHDLAAILQVQDEIIALDRELGGGRVELQDDAQARCDRDRQRLTVLRAVDGDRRHPAFQTFVPDTSHRRFLLAKSQY